MEFFRITRVIPFMKHALVFNVISLVTFLLAVLFLATRGLNLGVDFRGGTVIDGTGAPARRADVAVERGRIAAIGSDLAKDGARIIEAKDRVITPGFIDIHSHSDESVLINSALESSRRSRSWRRFRIPPPGTRRRSASARARFSCTRPSREWCPRILALPAR